METTISDEEESQLFEKKAKISGGTWYFVASFFLLGAALFIGSVWEAVSGTAWGTLLFAFAAAFALVCSLAWCLVKVEDATDQAAKQCLAVAEKYGLCPTSWQVWGFSSESSAGSVFRLFVEFIQQTRPEIIPEGTFIGSGGKSKEACRRLVYHLWSLGSPQEVAAEAMPETAQAGSG